MHTFFLSCSIWANLEHGTLQFVAQVPARSALQRLTNSRVVTRRSNRVEPTEFATVEVTLRIMCCLCSVGTEHRDRANTLIGPGKQGMEI